MAREAARSDSALTWAAVLLVAVSAFLGGASRENTLRLAAIELAALPLLVLTFRRQPLDNPNRRLRFPLIILALIVAVPALQLIPLPPAIWTALPGQAPRVEALRLAGLALGWRSMSLAPRNTQDALLALLPPAAMFLATIRLDSAARQRAAMAWLAVTAIGLGLGLAQLAAPNGGLVYPYATTNLGSLVGWFANRNHEAGCLLAGLPFAAIFAARGWRERSTARAFGWGLFCLTAIAALGVIRSRAGVFLAGPVMAVCGALAWREFDWRATGKFRGFGPAVALAIVGVLAMLTITPILDRLSGSSSPEFRFEAWPIVATAAEDFLPLGAGLGSFDRAFRAVEPLNLLAANYFNHAHNDYLELWLETGWIGAALIGAFLVWAVGAVRGAWTRALVFPKAASVAVLTLMVQSLVDYPLRTEALAVWFAFCCGVLAAPEPAVQ